MSCASETYVPTSAGLRTSLCLSRGDARARVTEAEREIRHATSGAQPTSRAVPDSTKADPEHIWGDEGPINE